MNILMINGADRKGGAHELAWELKCDLEAKGNSVEIFVDKKYSNSASVHEIENPAYQKLLSRLFASDIDFFSTNKILKTEQFKNADVIHCHNLHGRYFKLSTLMMMSKLKPLIWTLHDEWAVTSHCVHALNDKQSGGFYECSSLKTPPGIKWDNTRYLKWKKRRVYDNSEFTLVAPSEWLKKRISSTVLAKKNINIIYNGIDTATFKEYDKSSTRHELGLPIGVKIILFLAAGGKDNLWKGWNYVKEVVDAYAKDSKVMFLCVGNSEENIDINEKVKFLPFVFNKESLAKYYSAADLFLLPSLAENFPLTVLEAMSCGLPVVSFDVGGVKEAVLHRINGYIAKYGNLDDIKNGIKYVFGLDKENYDKMSLGCRQRVKENFSLDTMTSKYIDLYKQVYNSFKR